MSKRSPSGRGIHVIARGKKPSTHSRTGPYELYDDGRYFTVTGHHVVGTPTTVEERTPEIETLCGWLFATRDGNASPVNAPASTSSDDAVLSKARGVPKFERLWQGDTSGYDSHSEGDLAFCSILVYWTKRDTAQIDRLYRRSGLMRSKWDEKRGGSTVGAECIAKALSGNTTTPKRDEPIEDLHAFLARVGSQPELAWHIEGLIPEEGTCLWHGQPRDFKTWCAIDAGLAMASGRCAFNNSRFAVKRPAKVAYFTEEDHERLFSARVHWLTVKGGLPAEGCFFPFIRKGLNLDVAADRDFIIAKLQECGAEVAVFDPLRSFTGLSDKGPADLRPVAMFLRSIQNETRAKAIVIVHHDTKPLAVAPEGGDNRSRSQQASGGGVFSISDCPVSFKKLAWNKVAVFPEDYKLSGDPKPFEVTFETDERQGHDGPRFGSWVRAVAVTKDERDIVDGVTAQKILAFLHASPGTWRTTVEVDKGANLRRGTASAVLERLRVEGLVQHCAGEDAKALGHQRNAKLWCADEQTPPVEEALIDL